MCDAFVSLLLSLHSLFGINMDCCSGKTTEQVFSVNIACSVAHAIHRYWHTHTPTLSEDKNLILFERVNKHDECSIYSYFLLLLHACVSIAFVRTRSVEFTKIRDVLIINISMIWWWLSVNWWMQKKNVFENNRFEERNLLNHLTSCVCSEVIKLIVSNSCSPSVCCFLVNLRNRSTWLPISAHIFNWKLCVNGQTAIFLSRGIYFVFSSFFQLTRNYYYVLYNICDIDHMLCRPKIYAKLFAIHELIRRNLYFVTNYISILQIFGGFFLKHQSLNTASSTDSHLNFKFDFQQQYFVVFVTFALCRLTKFIKPFKLFHRNIKKKKKIGVVFLCFMNSIWWWSTALLFFVCRQRMNGFAVSSLYTHLSLLYTVQWVFSHKSIIKCVWSSDCDEACVQFWDWDICWWAARFVSYTHSFSLIRTLTVRAAIGKRTGWISVSIISSVSHMMNDEHCEFTIDETICWISYYRLCRILIWCEFVASMRTRCTQTHGHAHAHILCHGSRLDDNIVRSFFDLR